MPEEHDTRHKTPAEAPSAAGKQGKVGKQGRRPSVEAEAMLVTYRLRNQFDAERLANFAELESALGIKRGRPMLFQDADNGMANALNDLYNCAIAVVAHELRLYGFDVTAGHFIDAAGSPSVQLSNDTRLIWRKSGGARVEFDGVFNRDDKGVRGKLEREMSAVGGRYHIGWDPEDDSDGHIVTALRTSTGLFVYDPQKNLHYSLHSFLLGVPAHSRIEVLRVDRLLLDSALVSLLLEPV